MTSVCTELGSTRLAAELYTATTSVVTGAESSTPTPLPDILTRLGGSFAADIADILQQAPEKSPTAEPQLQKSEPLNTEVYYHQQFALARIRAKNITGAIDYIERHVPDLRGWLDNQLERFVPRYKRQQSNTLSYKPTNIFPEIIVVPDGILIDAEVGRIARIIGQFGVYRAWAFAHSVDDDDGWLERKELEILWQKTGVASSKRHARRIIQQGQNTGYWTQDNATKRIYLTGQVKVTTRIVETALAAGYHHLIETNKPGKRRVQVDLSGTLQEASARLYAAWLIAKDPDGKGTTISREMLCDLWQVSLPTLLAWEDIAAIGKQANFAQSNDTTLDNVPEYAYLTLNRDGSTAAAWRLPNTYTVNDKSIQQHTQTGKADQIRQAIRVEIALAEQRGWIGDAALPRSGKRYFTEDASHKVDAFRACSDYLRKASRKGNDLSQQRYFYVGQRHGVRVFEPYNMVTNVPETNIYQRHIWQENRPEFVAACHDFAYRVADYHEYMALLA